MNFNKWLSELRRIANKNGMAGEIFHLNIRVARIIYEKEKLTPIETFNKYDKCQTLESAKHSLPGGAIVRCST